MRAFLPTASRAALAAAVLAMVAPAGLGSAWAQDKGAAQNKGAAQDKGAARDKGATAGEAEAAQPKQVTLTQKSIDGLIAAQKQIRDIEAKMPKDAKAPDPKTEKAVNDAVKANGFATVNEFADASYSVGIVLAGIDPDTGKFVGMEAATKKQIEEVKADKEMPPKEKKEALAELDESLKASGTEKPSQGNIDIVTANMAKLNEGLKQAD